MIFRLLSYNVRFGGVGREQALAATIGAAAPDLVVFQEATRPDVVSRLAEATGMKRWAASPAHSVAFMSKTDVAFHEWRHPPGSRRSVLEIALAGSDVRVFAVHLSAIHSNWTERRRVRELRAVLDTIPRRDSFHVLAGDFNSLAPGEKFDLRRLPLHLQLVAWALGRKIRWETIQIMLDAKYIDGYRTVHPEAEGYTFPTWHPQVRLDYVFVPAAMAARLKSCQVVDGSQARVASDHFPLLAELDL